MEALHLLPQTINPTFAINTRRSNALFSVASFQPHEKSRQFLTSDWRSFRAKLVEKEHSLLPQDFLSGKQEEEKWVHPINNPEKGCLLIATEKLDGVHVFHRSVILLLSTGPICPTGLILNRPSHKKIKEIKTWGEHHGSGLFSDSPVLLGGLWDEGLFLVNPKEGSDEVRKIGALEEIVEGVYFGTKERVGCADEMVKRGVIGEEDLRFFHGYCGWGKDQLRDEIREGNWTVAACSSSVLGLALEGTVDIWDEIVGLLGPSKVR